MEVIGVDSSSDESSTEEASIGARSSAHIERIKQSRITGKRSISLALKEFQLLKNNVYICRTKKEISSQDIHICFCTLSPPNTIAGCLEGCVNRMMFVECMLSHCPCGLKCANQKLQKGILPRTRLVDVGNSKGIGLLTLYPLESGDFIGEYLGEVVSEQELKRRQQQEYMGEKHRYLMALGRKEFIDATRKGGLVRFMNHSCDPNCHVEKWEIDGEERIALFSSRPIKAMEELTYDYKFETFTDEAVACLCGDVNCRKRITIVSCNEEEEEKEEEIQDVVIQVDDVPELEDKNSEEMTRRVPYLEEIAYDPRFFYWKDMHDLLCTRRQKSPESRQRRTCFLERNLRQHDKFCGQKRPQRRRRVSCSSRRLEGMMENFSRKGFEAVSEQVSEEEIVIIEDESDSPPPGGRPKDNEEVEEETDDEPMHQDYSTIPKKKRQRVIDTDNSSARSNNSNSSSSSSKKIPVVITIDD